MDLDSRSCQVADFRVLKKMTGLLNVGFVLGLGFNRRQPSPFHKPHPSHPTVKKV